ncbi:MAG: hypothetical protein N2Z21_07950 [Candidatus Sumerlaeaceae bacterium]|nr:hypothetical protein [Candidatus Sumerlaeaceae bacterium]
MPANSSLRALFDNLLEAARNRSWNLSSPEDVEALAYYALAAREAGAGEKYREFKQLLAQFPLTGQERLSLDSWLVVAEALAPR